MNILITGANGFIASNLINNAENDWNVIGITRSGISGANRNYKVDLTNSNSVGEFLKQKDSKIDLIIHTASVLATNNNIRSMNLFYENMTITESVIEIIKEKKIPKLINFSSIAVYPNVDGSYTETSVIKPSVNSECLYGLSKFVSENLFDFFLKDQVTQLLHLRLSQVFGDNMRNDRIYKIMEKELKEFNRVTVFGKGERVSNFIDIQCLIKYIKFSIEYQLNGVFNIGGDNITYLQLANIIIEKLKISSPEIILEDKGVRSKTFIDTSKFEHLFLKYKCDVF